MKFLKAKIFLALVIMLLLINACSNQSASGNADQLREYAGDLINRSLYKQAIAAYEEYLKVGHIKEQEQANVNYIIAGTYFDRMNDYESALTYYLKIKHFYPEEKTLMNDVNKRIVACLERLERTEDASQALSESVQLDPNAVIQRRPGEIVAELGNRQITQGDLDYEISKLSPTIRNQVTTREQKQDFLREYVATELLYDTAQRAGLDKDPEVIEGSFQAKKALMVQKLLQDRVAGKVEI